MDFIKDFIVERSDNSEVSITGEIPFAVLEKHKVASVKALGENISIDGFRKGHIPEKVLLKRIGEMNIISEMAERALAEVYPKALEHHKIEAIGHPKVEITKVAPQNPLGFKATVATVPEIKLPDYKALAKEANQNKADTAVTDAEVDKQIEEILRSKAAYERMQQKAGAKHTHADGTVHDGPAHGDDTTDLPTPESEAAKEAELKIPELTDEVVKTLGQPGQFENVADFKAKIREHLEIQKKQDVVAAHRAKITDKIVEASQFALPQILIDSELNQMFAQMNEDLKRAGLKMEDYFTHIKKTREDLVKEWTPAAEKRARLQLVLNEIAKVENIEPDKEKFEAEVKHLLEHYKEADPTRVKIYVASVMQNEAVMKMLEEA